MQEKLCKRDLTWFKYKQNIFNFMGKKMTFLACSKYKVQHSCYSQHGQTFQPEPCSILQNWLTGQLAWKRGWQSHKRKVCNRQGEGTYDFTRNCQWEVQVCMFITLKNTKLHLGSLSQVNVFQSKHFYKPKFVSHLGRAICLGRFCIWTKREIMCLRKAVLGVAGGFDLVPYFPWWLIGYIWDMWLEMPSAVVVIE